MSALDPAMLVTAVPTWSVGDVITVGRDEQLRVIAIDDFPHAELGARRSRDLHRRAGVAGRTACCPVRRFLR
jgi:hypothetical protein